MNPVSVILAIILFSVVVLFHELGHFLLAKANGIKVNEFCLGLGPTLVGFTKGETKYSIKLLPFGGACMMEGEDEASDSDRAFSKKNVWQRMSVVFAGPFFNFIMAYIFAVIIICAVGYDTPVITVISEDYPMEAAGFKVGDEIVSIDGKHVAFYREALLTSFLSEGETVEFTVLRDGEKITKSVTPIYSYKDQRYYFGFNGGKNVKANFFTAIKYSFYEVKFQIVNTFKSLKLLFTGKASVNQMSGPVGIVEQVGNDFTDVQEKKGIGLGIITLLNWGVLLAANLGVMNLLPIPALDGGRLFFMIVEVIRRKKIDPDKEAYVHFAGIVLLLGLMVFVMFNDIRKLFL